ncbi:prepilin-type N-terminal cleavage/methylation domain-containing protein [Acidaminobacter sp. JC074]|uniref:pilus assembly FimT family protein n=1 Tax=Acidaminobacter sp. JC074 TaxID=2530199 RepID=UPI001F0DF9E8|nr:prepilin-type N-terminal cleavage/methylation domain-containing protein [Acidaminobacter sp. JC074]MCH4888805.1 prepilin-type N-terminal cleavage/methylation domain-containing protein [Acidaminobacter sp. JC074]
MKNKKGYTLVELIITLAVISIMIVPIFNSFIEANRVNLRSRRQISAAYLAQNTLEELKGMPRYDFTKMDTNAGDSIGVYDAAWSETRTETVDNGGTTFTVVTEMRNITRENIDLDNDGSGDVIVGVTVDNRSTSYLTKERDYNAKVFINSDQADVTYRTQNVAGSTYQDSDDTVYLLFTSTDDSLSHIRPVDESLVTIPGMESKNITTTGFGDDDMIVLNIEGYESLASNYTFHIINRSNWTIDAKPYTDNDHIIIKSHRDSTNNVYIGNSFPVAIGTPSSVKHYFEIVVTVSRNGEEFERIEAIIGK